MAKEKVMWNIFVNSVFWLFSTYPFLMMKFLLVTSILAFTCAAEAQPIRGQWRGEFTDRSNSNGNWGGEKCEYVLDLESNKNKLSGYSYTYFSEGGKRYYTICKLEGTIDPAQKSVIIRETERTKTNVPSSIQNCFQIHNLTYFKKGKEETLSGDWKPAPGQGGDCGFGGTVLTRTLLDNSVTAYNNSTSKINSAVSNSTEIVRAKPSSTNKSKSSGNKSDQATVIENNSLPLNNPDISVPVDAAREAEPKSQAPAEVSPLPKGYEKRSNTILKTIEVENQYIHLDLFDNGEIDGDSIALFYNGMMLVSHKRLTDKAISFTIMVDDDQVGEFAMYAENLGSIPPNTAVMVVTDGKKRYEARITSDLKHSGVIRFVRKKSS